MLTFFDITRKFQIYTQLLQISQFSHVQQTELINLFIINFAARNITTTGLYKKSPRKNRSVL